MKGIYETSQKDPALIINETVRCIYKNDNHPENHVIKMVEKTAQRFLKMVKKFGYRWME